MADSAYRKGLPTKDWALALSELPAVQTEKITALLAISQSVEAASERSASECAQSVACISSDLCTAPHRPSLLPLSCVTQGMSLIVLPYWSNS